MEKKIKGISAAFLAVIWLALALFAWFGEVTPYSDAERRPLATMPQLSESSLSSGSFMADFETYTQDQFPLRESFRRLKALVNYGALNRLDNNGIYISDGSAAELLYPLDEDSVAHAAKQFQGIYDRYLADAECKIYSAIVPDKSYYLSENGYLRMDYEKMFSQVAQAMPWAEHIDLTGALSAQDYYRTDTHWRQEQLLPAAKILCDAMGVTVPKEENYQKTAVDRTFYGVYYGQASLPLAGETLYLMESPLLSECKVYSYEKDVWTQVYDRDKLTSKDLYEVYLSGAESLLRIENPAAETGKELIVFRDSFASSMIPLILEDYETVTLVDIRYINPRVLGQFLSFSDQDVLFLYSTLVLNKNLL